MPFTFQDIGTFTSSTPCVLTGLGATVTCSWTATFGNGSGTLTIGNYPGYPCLWNACILINGNYYSLSFGVLCSINDDVYFAATECTDNTCHTGILGCATTGTIGTGTYVALAVGYSCSPISLVYNVTSQVNCALYNLGFRSFTVTP